MTQIPESHRDLLTGNVVALGFDFDVDDIDQPGDRRVKLVFHPTRINANDPSAYAAT